MSTSHPSMTADVFAAPPDDPLPLLKSWFDSAVAASVQQPGALALATVDAGRRVSSRIVQVLQVRPAGLVFASHTDSRKGRDLAETPWASGVLYWREVARQVCVSGPARPLPAQESDALWNARPVDTHPMSVAAHQSAPLLDEEALRERARELGRDGVALPRPERWVGYLLEPASVEFWQSEPEDRLHRRLWYEREGPGWHTCRLQP
ncbi:Phenazine biosynthesis protein PhzG [Streptomyces sp. enrichment culture]